MSRNDRIFSKEFLTLLYWQQNFPRRKTATDLVLVLAKSISRWQATKTLVNIPRTLAPAADPLLPLAGHWRNISCTAHHSMNKKQGSWDSVRTTYNLESTRKCPHVCCFCVYSILHSMDRIWDRPCGIQSVTFNFFFY